MTIHLRSALATLVAAGILLGVLAGLESDAKTSGPGREIGSGSQLLVDDDLVAERHGVVRTLHPGKKLPDPVVVPDRPWEGQRIYTYGTIHYDEKEGLFRMWYNTSLGTIDEGRAPELRLGDGHMVLYATSRDGIDWDKPALGLYEFDGSRQNNIVYDIHSPSVIVDETSPNPDERYKMIGYKGGDLGGYLAAHSADGLRWKPYPVERVLMHSDTITVTKDPWTGEYLAFHKRPAIVRGFPRRVVWLATSRDFQNWGNTALVLAPDERDDHWVREPEHRSEFYNLSAFPYGEQFLGLVTDFRVTKIIPRDQALPLQSPWDGPIDVQLVHSRDGRSWNRFEDRSPIIELGEPGSFDGGTILGVSNPPVIHNDEVWVYYTAINTTHGAPLPPKHITVGRASWRLDGFVSLDAGSTEGMVETILLKPEGDRLTANADASQGHLEVELVGADGRVIPGYSREEMNSIRSDSVRHVISWKGGREHIPSNRAVGIRFYLQNTQLYSFRFASD